MKVRTHNSLTDIQKSKDSIEFLFNLYKNTKIDSLRKLEEAELEHGFPFAPIYIYGKYVDNDIMYCAKFFVGGSLIGNVCMESITDLEGIMDNIAYGMYRCKFLRGDSEIPDERKIYFSNTIYANDDDIDTFHFEICEVPEFDRLCL